MHDNFFNTEREMANVVRRTKCGDRKNIVSKLVQTKFHIQYIKIIVRSVKKKTVNCM